MSDRRGKTRAEDMRHDEVRSDKTDAHVELDEQKPARDRRARDDDETTGEPLNETTLADESERTGLSEETTANFIFEEEEANDDAVIKQISEYTDDEDVLEDFAERQQFDSGSEKLFNKLIEHHSLSPDLSGEDIDAAWEDSDVSGEESVGGTTPTPDQDIVEELGEAVGIRYDDDEPLNTFDKLSQRDANRFELDPETMADMAGDQVPEEDTPYAEDLKKERRLEETAGAMLGEDDKPSLDLEERATLSEDDTLDKDLDAIGDAAFPEEVDEDDRDDEEDYM